MADNKKYLHNLDVVNNKVMNLLLNPLTTTQRTTIGGTLGLADEGYVCYDLDLNQQYFWNGAAWITVSGGVTAVTATSPLFSSLGSTPDITIQQASGSQDGYLSSGDWTIFNNKQNALTNPVTGTGTTNYIPKWSSSSALTDSQIFDNGSNVGIGTATPTYNLDILGTFHTTGQNTLDNLATGVGVGTRVVTANSVGLLVNDDLVTNFVKYNDILTEKNFSGRTVYVSPLAMSAGLFSTSFGSTTQAQWIITDTPLAGGVRNGKIRRYQWKNMYTPVVPAFTGSTSGTTLTTVGSPALTSGMWIRLDDETGLGQIQGGSGNTWTLNVSTNFASQNMNAYLGIRNVYSQGFLYFGFWNLGRPATITATFKSQQFSSTAGSIQDWGTTVNGSNISVSAVHSYWRVPIPVSNYITDIEVTFTPDATNNIDYMTQEMVVNFAEGIDVIPFINKDGGNMYGTLSFLSGSNGLASNIKGSITNAGALTMATGKFTALPSSSSNTEMVSINSTTGVLSKQTIPTSSGGTVISVDLTMPSAFKVTGNPVTTSGTLAVTGNGLVSQYVRGDGSLADFPISTGGGASVSYYLNGSVNQGVFGSVTYYEMNGTPVIGTGTDFTINANGYIAQFITDAGDPNKLLIPAGNWNFETYFSASSGGGSPSFYIELYKVSATNVFTLIASNSATPENITGGTSIDLYFTALAVPSTVLLVTDRLAVRFFVTYSGRTITMHTEDSHLSQIITTFSTGLTALNGLTAQVQNFANDTNVTMVSSGSTHTIAWVGTLADNRIASATTWNSKQNARSVNVVSTSTTAGSAAGTDYVYLVSGTSTITLPTAVGNTNRYTIKRSGTGVVSIATISSQTIDDSSSSINISVQYVSIDLMSDGANWFII